MHAVPLGAPLLRRTAACLSTWHVQSAVRKESDRHTIGGLTRYTVVDASCFGSRPVRTFQAIHGSSAVLLGTLPPEPHSLTSLVQPTVTVPVTATRHWKPAHNRICSAGPILGPHTPATRKRLWA